MPCLDSSLFTHLPACCLLVCSPRCHWSDLSHVHWVSLPELKLFVAFRKKKTTNFFQDLLGKLSCHLMPPSVLSPCLSHSDLWPHLTVLQQYQILFCPRTFAQGSFGISLTLHVATSFELQVSSISPPQMAFPDHTHSKPMPCSPLFSSQSPDCSLHGTRHLVVILFVFVAFLL